MEIQEKTYMPTILIVDDNKKNLQVLGNILHEEAYKVAIAMNGETALKLASKIHPDIIILDIMMPGMSGFDVCKILKADDDTKDIPVIFLTAKVEVDDIVEGFTLGGVDYMTKPFKKKELLVRLKTHLDLLFSKKKIEAQSLELQKANSFKSKLFSIIGHDLRSPISSVKMTLEMARGGYIDHKEDKFKHTIINLLQSTDEAFTLLENLLGWAKSQSGTLSIAAEKLNMLAVAQSVKRLLDLNLTNKNINLCIDIADNITAYADNQMTNTVLRNLLSNAIKFTPENGTITIRAKEHDNEVRISLIDSGVGIPPESLAKLFVAEKPVQTYGTNKESGSGLGLILCKDFVEKNNGILTVESEVGKGSTFTFTLPKNNEDPTS